jgi:sulfatase modifying factor 1
LRSWGEPIDVPESPSEERNIKRKLATILVADIVGYSRLTAQDEDGTIRRLGEFRDVVDEIIAKHDGRIFNTGGDSVLAEFTSPVEAVRSAIDFQEAARSRNILQPPERQLRFRIGINLGDVLVRGNDLLGDGVNVAARLEGLAEPGGICVSGTVWDHIHGKLSLGYVDIGEQTVKNIPRPIRAYRLQIDGSVEEVAAPVRAGSRAASRRPTGIIAAIAGGIAAIVAAGGLLAWQFWPHNATMQAARTPVLPAATQNQPSAADAQLREVLAARLAAAAPALGDKIRDEAVRAYIAAAGHKAQAVSQEPAGHWRAAERPTVENAVESTLEDCQVYFGRPCLLIASDETVQPVPPGGKWTARDMARVRYSGDFDPAQIPGVLPTIRERADVVTYHAAALPKAAAFNPAGGRIFIAAAGASQRAVEEEALKACAEDLARRNVAGVCLLYAAENRVVLPLRLKEPLTPAAPMTAAAATAATTAPPVVAPPLPAAQAAIAPPRVSGAKTPGESFRDCPNCPEMVVVPAGHFLMGSDIAEHGHFLGPRAVAAHEQPQHEVTIAKPFALAKFDVTRGEFAAFAKATGFHSEKGCMTLAERQWVANPELDWESPGFTQTARDPVVCVNRSVIEAYLLWLQRQTGKQYRLPSEAEWEYAARAGTATPFYWGAMPGQVCQFENVADQTAKDTFAEVNFIAMPCRDGFAHTAPVGSFKPNPFGLFDMLGNVSVATADCWNDGYGGAPADGSAWSSGDCARHVMRKASFGNGRPFFFRVAHRFPDGVGYKRNRTGFRVAVSLP